MGMSQLAKNDSGGVEEQGSRRRGEISTFLKTEAQQWIKLFRVLAPYSPRMVRVLGLH